MIALASLCYALFYHCPYNRSWSYLCGWSFGSYRRPSGRGHRRPCFLLGRLFVWTRPPSIWAMRQATMCPTWAAVRLAPTPVHLAMATGVHVSYLSNRSSSSDGRPSGRCDGLLGQPFVQSHGCPCGRGGPTWAAGRLAPTAVHLAEATGDHASYLGGCSSGSDCRPSGRCDKRPCALPGRPFVWLRSRPSGYEDRCPCVLFGRPFVWLRRLSIRPWRRPTWAAVRLALTAAHVAVAMEHTSV